jgi:hypothetical protein
MTRVSRAKNFHAMGTLIEVGVRGFVSMVARSSGCGSGMGNPVLRVPASAPLLGLEHVALRRLHEPDQNRSAGTRHPRVGWCQRGKEF